MWFNVVCSLIDNDMRHHNGQNVVVDHKPTNQRTPEVKIQNQSKQIITAISKKCCQKKSKHPISQDRKVVWVVLACVASVPVRSERNSGSAY